MSRIIVERTFDPPVTQEALADVKKKMLPCLQTYRVRWVRSYLSLDRKRMVCEYEAPDAEAVRDVQREAAAPYERVWNADLLEG
ncbi:MAG: DUF4242 domain-containing protein [Acidobacteriota bacterium]